MQWIYFYNIKENSIKESLSARLSSLPNTGLGDPVEGDGVRPYMINTGCGHEVNVVEYDPSRGDS